MLAIRMQRTGRKGHAMFRVVVQDSHRTPTSGKLVATLGSFDPHAKSVILDKEKAAFYLEHGAQPSDRIARLLKNEGVKLPSWVKISEDKERSVKNPDKRRSTMPPAPVEAAPVETAAPAVEPEAPETMPEEAPVAVEETAATSEAATDEVVTSEAVETSAEPEATPEEPAAEEPKA